MATPNADPYYASDEKITPIRGGVKRADEGLPQIDKFNLLMIPSSDFSNYNVYELNTEANNRQISIRVLQVSFIGMSQKTSPVLKSKNI